MFARSPWLVVSVSGEEDCRPAGRRSDSRSTWIRSWCFDSALFTECVRLSELEKRGSGLGVLWVMLTDLSSSRCLAARNSTCWPWQALLHAAVQSCGPAEGPIRSVEASFGTRRSSAASPHPRPVLFDSHRRFWRLAEETQTAEAPKGDPGRMSLCAPAGGPHSVTWEDEGGSALAWVPSRRAQHPASKRHLPPTEKAKAELQEKPSLEYTVADGELTWRISPSASPLVPSHEHRDRGRPPSAISSSWLARLQGKRMGI